MKMLSMKVVLGVVAGTIAIFGFINFFLSINTPTPIPIALSHPLAMVAMAYLLFQVIFPRMLYPSTIQSTVEVTQRLRLTGSEIATGVCGGRIGSLRFRGPLIRVRVFPGGIFIKPILLPATPILREEITTLQEKRRFLSSCIEIVHTSKCIITPIQLGFDKDSNVGKALFLLQATS
jgi:hypothetical protein